MKISNEFRNELADQSDRPHLVVFDLCDTLYYSNTTFDFIEYLLNQTKAHLKLFFFLILSKKYSVMFWLLIVVEKFAIKNLVRNLAITLLKGISKERIYDYSKRFVEEYLPDKVIYQIHDMLDQAIKAKAAVYLISDSLDPIVKAVAESFDIDFKGEELEFNAGYSTGQFQSYRTKLSRIEQITEGIYYKRLIIISDNKSDRNLLEIADRGYAVIHKKRDRLFWESFPKIRQIYLG